MFTLSAGTRVRRLTSEDGPALQRLLERCSDYAEVSFGIPTGAADAQSQFLEGLDRVAADQKYLLGVASATRTRVLLTAPLPLPMKVEAWSSSA